MISPAAILSLPVWTYGQDAGNNAGMKARKQKPRKTHPDTAPLQHCGKRSADLRIGTNRRFPANLAESEFGVPLQFPGAPFENLPDKNITTV
jgi:hypothetical protein